MNENSGVWRQRFGYGAADFASNLIWQVIGLYLMYFYTDVVGLVAAEVGTLFLVTRLVDGVADVTMGVIIDKTKSRWGKSRPWFLWGAAPFAFFGIATFYVPKLGHTGEIGYAFLTYLGLSMAYTIVNIPLSSILPSLTRDPNERTTLTTFRIMLAILGSTLVSTCTLPLVKLLGGDSKSAGFFWTMVIFAVTGACLFIFTFLNVEEKVKVRHHHITVREAFSSLKGNTPWYVFAVNIVFMWGAYFFAQGTLIYYFTYNVGRPDMVKWIAGLSSFIPLFGAFTAPFLARKFHKRTIYLLASAINLAGIGVMFASNVWMPGLFAGMIVSALGFGLRTTIYFSMQADPVDYGEWKSGISAPGVISSTNGFISKVAMAVAGAVSGWMLTLAHYVPNQAQQPSALWAIKLNFLIIPAGLVIISMIIMCFYNLDKIYPKIRAEIDERIESHII
jgi:GPH family glycoside/pentoside/hexuronide:cation symporter